MDEDAKAKEISPTLLGRASSCAASHASRLGLPATLQSHCWQFCAISIKRHFIFASCEIGWWLNQLNNGLWHNFSTWLKSILHSNISGAQPEQADAIIFTQRQKYPHVKCLLIKQEGPDNLHSSKNWAVHHQHSVVDHNTLTDWHF